MGILRIEAPRWCGFGVSGGLLPEIRLGWLRFTVASNTFARELEENVAALKLAFKALRSISEDSETLREEIAERDDLIRRQAITIDQLEMALDDALPEPQPTGD